MNKFLEKKITKLELNINTFIEDVKGLQKKAVESGKKALKVGSKQQIDFWVVQYKLTEQYTQQANEILGQLDIARYSSTMQKTAKDFFSCMGKMAKQLSKVFTYTNFDQIQKNFDKNQDKIENAKEQNKEIIEETTERFREMQERLTETYEDIEVSEEEKNKIINIFSTSKTVDNVNIFDRMLG